MNRFISIIITGGICFSTGVFGQMNFLPDTSISSVCLGCNEDSLLYEKRGLSEMYIVSKDSLELLIVQRFFGSSSNCFYNFSVKKRSNERYDFVSNDSVFFTESGICLGINIQQLICIKGEDYSCEIEGEKKRLIYMVKNYESSNFLKKYNMPEYRASYFFENEVLVAYEFGFIEP